jgi:hypothetical protein
MERVTNNNGWGRERVLERVIRKGYIEIGLSLGVKRYSMRSSGVAFANGPLLTVASISAHLFW